MIPKNGFAALVLLCFLTRPIFAQDNQFPLVATVTASESDRVPTGSSTSTTTAMPGTIWEHPQQRTNVHYGYQITVTAELDNKIYRLASPQLLDPGDYPASIDKNIVRILTKDKKGKPKTIKLAVVSVAAKQ